MSPERQLQVLFEAAGNGHHQAFQATDGADPEWPLWYADYLHSKLSNLLGITLTKSELTYLLVLADKRLKLDAPGADWTRYYARFFLSRYR
jgi:hypothetical protein